MQTVKQKVWSKAGKKKKNTVLQSSSDERKAPLEKLLLKKIKLNCVV